MEQSQSRLDVAFPFEPGDQLLSALRDLMRVLEARLQGAERQQATADQQADILVDVGLARINAVLLPQVLKIQKLTSLGFLVCQSSSSVKLEIAQKIFVVPEGDQREFFTPSPFVTIESRADFSTYAVARVLTYDAKTGVLVVSIIGAYGDGQPHTDWTISCSSGVGLATTAAANNAAGSATAAQASAVKTAADALATAGDRAAARGDRLAADAYAQAAANSAAAANTWNPANYVPRTGAILGKNGQYAFVDNGVGLAIKDRPGDGSALQVQSATNDGLTAAAMTFHRPGSYACWFGLDADNEFARGGWSDGTQRFKFWTEKNSNPNASPRYDTVQSFLPTQKRQIKYNAGIAGAGYQGIVSQTSTIPATSIGSLVFLSGSAFTTTLPKMNAGDSIKFFNSTQYPQTFALPAGASIYNDGAYGTSYVLPPYGKAVFECFSDDGSVLVFDGPPIASTPSVNSDQTFTQDQKRRVRKNIGAQWLNSQAFANRTLGAGDLNSTVWCNGSALVITLPPISVTSSGDFIEFTNYSNNNLTIAANRTNSEASGIFFGAAGGNAATMTLGPGQSVRLTTDGGSWVSAYRALPPEAAAALAGAAFTGNVSVPSLQVAGKSINGPTFGTTSGGNQADVNVQNEGRLTLDFVATSTNLLTWCQGRISNNSPSAADIYWSLNVLDMTAGQAGVLSRQLVAYAAGSAGSTGVATIVAYVANLTYGHTYRLYIGMFKGQAVGPMYPNDMVLSYMNF